MSGRASRRVRKLSILLASVATVAAASPAFAIEYTTGFRYDPSHRLTGEIAPDADGASPWAYPATRYTYSVDGQLTLIEKGVLSSWQSETVAPSAWTGFAVQQQTAFSYDARGIQNEARVTAAVGGVKSVTQYSYDASGRLTCTAVRMNLAAIPATGSDACVPGTPDPVYGADRITKNIYDAAGQVLQTRQGVGTGFERPNVTYSYTTNGKQQDVIDGLGNHAKLIYDGFDRKQQWQFPSATAPASFDGSTPAQAIATAGAVNTSDFEQWTYDNNSNVTLDRKRDGRSVVIDYDNLDRRMKRHYRDAAGGDEAAANWVWYDYDLRGLQKNARFGSLSGPGLASTYDNAERLTIATDSTGGTALSLQYQYDPASNRVQVKHPDNNLFTYDYDAQSNVTVIKENGSAALATFAYFDTGERRTLTRAGGAVTTYGYDGISRLTSLQEDFVNNAGEVTFGFAYGPASQMTQRTRTNDAYAYVDTPALTRPYAVNGLNQYTHTGQSCCWSASFGYDPNGNLISSADIASGITTNYTYDVENRLIAASGGKTATLNYDPNGRLYNTSGTSGATRLLYDGDSLVAEYNGGTLLRRYVHGPGVDEPLVWYEGSAVVAANRRFLHSDHQGSIVAVSDSSGNVMPAGAGLAIDTYDEYGIPGNANQTLTQRFQYTGQIFVPELGLYHYKARTYSPTLGRFMQTDPVGYEDQINLYAYIGNDPINAADPTGLTCDPVQIGNKVFGQAFCDAVNKSPLGSQLIDPVTMTITEDRANDIAKEANFDANGPSEDENGLSYLFSGYFSVKGVPNEAQQVTSQQFPGDNCDSCEANAFKHGYLNARMTDVLGPGGAKDFADAHERGIEAFNSQNLDLKAASLFDLINNNNGRILRQIFPKANPVLLIKAGLRYHVLQTKKIHIEP